MLFKILLYILYFLLRLLNLTYRYRFIDKHNLEEAKSKHAKGAYIFAVWHQNAVAGSLSHIGNPHCAMISQSKDGELVAFVYKHIGLVPVRGSSTRGGKNARNKIIELINNQGLPAAITIDGPKGPYKQIKSGIIDIAKNTGVAIVPIMPIPDRYWSFRKAWDHFRLPKPFAKIVFKYGKPIYIPTDIDRSEYPSIKATITKELEDGQQKCRDYFSEW